MSVEKLVRAIAVTLVRDCENCHGAGEVVTAFLMDGSRLRGDCAHCASLRKALEEEE